MNKELVPYQESLELKELGFDEKGFVKVRWLNSVHYQTKVPFEPHITMNGHDIKFEYPIPEKHPLTKFGFLELQVPTFSQAFRWFREKYGLRIRNYVFVNYSRGISEGFEIFKYSKDTIDRVEALTYEEAELACLKKLIEIVKQK